MNKLTKLVHEYDEIRNRKNMIRNEIDKNRPVLALKEEEIKMMSIILETLPYPGAEIVPISTNYDDTIDRLELWSAEGFAQAAIDSYGAEGLIHTRIPETEAVMNMISSIVFGKIPEWKVIPFYLYSDGRVKTNPVYFRKNYYMGDVIR